MTLFRRALPLALITSCAALALSGCDTAQAESEASLISGQADSASVVQASFVQANASGPRVARSGEPSIGNSGSFDLKFKHLAQLSVDRFEGRCTVDDIIRDSGWTEVANHFAPKDVDYFVGCEKK